MLSVFRAYLVTYMRAIPGTVSRGFGWLLRSTGSVLRVAQTPIHWWWSSFRNHPIFALILAGIMAGLVAISFALFLRLAKPQPALVIIPFEVPSRNPTAVAFSGRSVANLLVDELRRIVQLGNVPWFVRGAKSTATITPPLDRPASLHILMLTPESPGLGVEIGDGVSANMLFAEWKRIRQQQVLVTGDVIFGRDNLVLQVRIIDKESWAAGPFPATQEGLNAAINAIALKLLSDVDPPSAGRYHNRRGAIEESLVVYRDWMRREPKSAYPYFYVGGSLALKGDHEGAARSYRKALVLRPDYPAALNNLGTTFDEMGQLNEAINAFQKALKLKPSFVETLTNLCGALSENGQPDEAVSICQKSLRLKPDTPEALTNLGVALLKMKQPEDAIAVFRKVVDLEPDEADSHYNLGLAFREAGQREEAAREFAVSQQLSPRLRIPNSK